MESAPSPPRVLLIAEAANPEWVSVPLVGWSHASALRAVARVHVVTQTRNQAAIERAGWSEGVDFTAIDSEDVARPLWRAGDWLRRALRAGWTMTVAVESLSYYRFEQLLWRRFGPRLARGEFDVVHRLTPLSPTIASIVAARCERLGVPFVWGPINGGVAWPKEFRDVQHKEGEWLSYVRGAHRLMPGYVATRRSAAALVVGSMATLQQFEEYREKCVYVPENGVDSSKFASDRKADTGPLRIVFVGRLVPYKGADMLIEAVASLAESGKVVVDILGDGPERASLEHLVRRRGLENAIHLRGWVQHEALRDYMAGAHVFGFPSVREFGGGVVLEAMALGLVPIVVDYAGPAELVTEKTGFRIPLGEREQIIEALRQLLGRLAEDRSSLDELSRNARRRVQTLYTWEQKAAQLRQVYDWVLGRAKRPDFGMPFPDEVVPAGGTS